MREINVYVGRRHAAEALQSIDTALGDGNEDSHRLLALAADIEFRRGRYGKSHEMLESTINGSGKESDFWLMSHLLNVRTLLRDVRIDEASLAAEQCFHKATDKWNTFHSACKQAAASVGQGLEAHIPRRPERLCVVASKLARVFLDEGEMESAKLYFNKAISGNPKGGCRARQGLAEIALREGQTELALQRASEALILGKFQAKTLGTWPLLIRALHLSGKNGIGSEIYAALQGADPGVRARSVVEIAVGLRSISSPQWPSQALKWMNQEGRLHPRQKSQIQLLLLADLKNDSRDPAKQLEIATDILKEKKISIEVWLSAAKECVRASCFMPTVTNPAPILVQESRRRYGIDATWTVMHSLALSLMMGKRHDWARILLHELISAAPQDGQAFAKGLWALARMENLLGKTAVATVHYRRYCDIPGLGDAFRLRGEIEWVRCLAASGDFNSIKVAMPRLRQVVEKMNDYESVLNIARQIQNAPEPIKSMANEFYKQGRDLALRQFEQETIPEEAARVLFHLARRQVFDFRAYLETVEFWNKLPETKRLWLWSSASPFWEYLGFVVEAHIRSDMFHEAESLAHTYLEDSATPTEGLVHVGMPLAEGYLDRTRISEAMDLFRGLTDQAPTHYACARAWYWQALSAWKEGNKDQASQIASRILPCLGRDPNLLHDAELEAKALLLKADLDTSLVSHQRVNYSNEKKQLLVLAIKKDLQLI
jgi:tetratricopeptide (TPR) repeat protein